MELNVDKAISLNNAIDTKHDTKQKNSKNKIFEIKYELPDCGLYFSNIYNLRKRILEIKTNKNTEISSYEKEIISYYKEVKINQDSLSFLAYASDKIYIVSLKSDKDNTKTLGIVSEDIPNRVIIPEIGKKTTLPITRYKFYCPFDGIIYFMINQFVIDECEGERTFFKKTKEIEALLGKYKGIKFDLLKYFKDNKKEDDVHVVFLRDKEVKTLGTLKNGWLITEYGNYNRAAEDGNKFNMPTYQKEYDVSYIDLGQFKEDEYRKCAPFDETYSNEVPTESDNAEKIVDFFVQEKLHNLKGKFANFLSGFKDDELDNKNVEKNEQKHEKE